MLSPLIGTAYIPQVSASASWNLFQHHDSKDKWQQNRKKENICMMYTVGYCTRNQCLGCIHRGRSLPEQH